MAKGNINDVLKVKTQTKVGELRKLLMILETSLKTENLPAAFDVLWAIEANPLFIAAEESLKEKKDDKKEDKDDKKDKKKVGVSLFLSLCALAYSPPPLSHSCCSYHCSFF